MLRRPTPAEKAAVVRGFRVFAAGIALLLTVAILGPGLAWIPSLLVAGVLIGYGIAGLRRAARVRSWLRVPGRVLGTSVGEVAEPGKVAMYTHYYPVVEFEYATPRGRFTASGYGPAAADHRSLDRAEIEAVLARYPEGAEIQVYARPADHATAVLEPGISRTRRSQYLAAIVAGLLVIAVTIWAVT